MGLKVEKRVIHVEGDVAYKTYTNHAEARAEAAWYRRVPWATPELLDLTGGTLTIRRHPVAEHHPDWRRPHALRDLLLRLHREGIHHRDVHVRNIVRSDDGMPLLIDWEAAVLQATRYSYDLYGPVISGVSLPEIHTVAQWWGCDGICSIGKNWGDIVYQPWFKNGKTIGTSQRDCVSRYDAIARQLEGKQYFSVLDFGAYSGYFALRLAHEFDAQCIAVDADPHLKQGLDIAGDPRVAGIHRHLDLDEVRELGHFDVGICMSVLHHVPWWRDLVAALRHQCGDLFIETASTREKLPTKAEADRLEAEQTMLAMGGTVIARTPGFGSDVLRPLWHIPEPGVTAPTVGKGKRRRKK